MPSESCENKEALGRRSVLNIFDQLIETIST